MRATGKIQLVGWDADRVMYNDFITSICARESRLDPVPYLRDFVAGRGWFTYEDVGRWAASAGKDLANPVKTVADLAACLTAFLYDMKRTGSDQSVITKQQAIDGKQALLAGLSISDIERISAGIGYTPGFYTAMEAFSHDWRKQTLFSDGLGPHIEYQVSTLGLDAGSGVPPIVRHAGKEFEYTPRCPKDAVLTGRIGKFDKAAAFFGYLGSPEGVPMSDVAVIDDSGANVKTLLVPVRDAGGVAVGFNVTDAHRPAFREASIPIIRGDSLEPFIEIVRDPSEATIGRYCE